MREKKISVQDVAEILVDELSKVERHSLEMAKIQQGFSSDLANFEKVCSQHSRAIDQLTKRSLRVDSSPLVSGVEQVVRSKVVIPRLYLLLLVLQPLVIAIITTLLVWAYIDDVELVAWNRGKDYALSQTE